MFNRIKEYFRKPQVGDIWYFRPINPFDKPYRYIITDTKGGWVRFEPVDYINELAKQVNTQERRIKYLKQLYKREV